MNHTTVSGPLQGAPDLTSFIGRRDEIATTRGLLAHARLLTLLGPGGVGKTRLSLELAARSRKTFRDGAWVVELAALEDGSLIGSQIATALRLPDQSNRSPLERLADYLRDRQLLLIMDNCEHLVEDVADVVAQLLEVAPGLRVLTTSREPLEILGEQIYLVPPLAAPSDSAAAHQSIEAYDSVLLLIDRARSIDPEFQLTSHNQSAIAQICQRLDGIPLAIELAASRLRSLSITELLKRLDRRFDLLTGGNRVAVPRQATLRALVDWSYELCSPAERLLWARLTVFPGGFDLEAAEEVCGFGEIGRGEVLDLLDHLISKSLVVAERPRGSLARSGQQQRYRQLFTFREYGAELLEASGETADLRRRQRDHYLQRAADMVSKWCGPDQAGRLAAARRDHANLLSALEWSATTPGEELAGATLAALLRYHWHAGGNLSDGRRWMDRLLALTQEPTAERGNALWSAAWVCLVQGDRDGAKVYLEECRQVAELRNDPVLAAHADHWDALRHLFGGDLEPAIDMFGSAIAVHRRVGDTMSALIAVFQRAWAQAYAGRAHAEAGLAACQGAIAESEALGELWTKAYSHWVSGLCQRHLGDLDSALSSQMAGLEIERDFLDGICTALTIDDMAWTLAAKGQFEQAGTAHLAARSVWRGFGTSIAAFGPHLEGDSLQTINLVQQALGESRVAQIHAAVGEPSEVEAIEIALKNASGATEVAAPLHSPSGQQPAPRINLKTPTGVSLTKREQQIAGLLSEGNTNKDIAGTLVISPRTVDGHVENILSKLGFTSRTQIAAWYVGQGEKAAN